MESPCKGGLRVSEKALLSMTGDEKFAKKYTTSQSEVEISEIMDLLDSSNQNMDITASKLGITKSSLKRKINPKDPYPPAYDEVSPSGSTRRYLEKSYGRWKVASFDASKSRACLETLGPTKVHLSVEVSVASKFRTI